MTPDRMGEIIKQELASLSDVDYWQESTTESVLLDGTFTVDELKAFVSALRRMQSESQEPSEQPNGVENHPCVGLTVQSVVTDSDGSIVEIVLSDGTTLRGHEDNDQRGFIQQSP